MRAADTEISELVLWQLFRYEVVQTHDYSSFDMSKLRLNESWEAEVNLHRSTCHHEPVDTNSILIKIRIRLF